MNILILSPYPPYPPHGGGTMRIYQFIRGLAARHHVTCLTFAPDAAAERALAPLHALGRVLVVRGPPPRSPLRRAWTTAASPLPDMALRNAAPAYADALRALLATTTFDIIQAESIEMAGYLPSLGFKVKSSKLSHGSQASTLNSVRAQYIVPLPLNSRLVLDQFNAEFVLQRRAALASLRAAVRGGVNAGQLAGAAYSLVQWLKLARYERRVMRGCNAVLAVSEEDRRALHRLDPALPIAVAPNGVDTAQFSQAALASARVGLAFSDTTLVFSGTLDFRPNIDAVLWFARDVLPRIRARCPGARLVVVGKRPPPALLALARTGAVTIIGEVPDARPYIAGAAVYVVPMRIGGGVRLKLLEALSLEVPVVSTSMGAEGVAGLRDGEHCLLADDPDRFAEAVLRLLADRVLGRRLGAAGRALVCQGYDWSAIVPRLELIYADLHQDKARKNLV